MLETTQSSAEFQKAQTCFPGGVNSPVRAFRAVNREPLFIREAKGAYLYDLDGNRYLDYVLSWGPLILGHAHPPVVAAICETAAKGTSFGAPSPLETLLAQQIKGFLPSIEKMRMVSSGTEATMSAVRLARGVTGREKIVKFKGCYHGHSDSFLVNAGSGVATFELEDSPGVPKSLSQATLSLEFNDLAAVKELFQREGHEIAAVIVEPVAGNMGLVPGKLEFLQGLRSVTSEYGALLIFDEVMSGFRCDYCSAQGFFGIEPDLTTLGKVVGGGLPAAVFGGKAQYMDQIAPAGAVYQAGTLSGNPLAMAAGITTLNELTAELYAELAAKVQRLRRGLETAAKAYNVPLQTVQQGTMWGFFFNSQPVTNFSLSKASNQAYFAAFYQALLDEGVYLAPSQYETNFISSAHTDQDIDATIAAFNQAFAKLAAARII